jgi:redox-sensitive bicupin YhaK (pirin superfamily)
MTAGTGIRHSEYNPSKTEKLHFYQIWILPEKDDLEAGYEQKMFAPEEKSGS